MYMSNDIEFPYFCELCLKADISYFCGLAEMLSELGCFTRSCIKLLEYVNEPPRGKTNNVVSEQVRHKPACTSTEKS